MEYISDEIKEMLESASSPLSPYICNWARQYLYDIDGNLGRDLVTILRTEPQHYIDNNRLSELLIRYRRWNFSTAGLLVKYDFVGYLEVAYEYYLEDTIDEEEEEEW